MDENNTLKENNGLISAGDIRVITIIGQIEGHTELQKEAKTTKYEHIIPMITDIALDKTAKGILTI